MRSVRGVSGSLALVVALALVPTGVFASEPPLTPVPYDPLPTSLEQLPLGAPTALPWWQKGVLHVGEVSIPTKLRRIGSRAGTTVVGRGSGLRRSRTEWRLVRGDRLRRLPTHGSTEHPLVSADGRWIAWLDAHRPPFTGEVETIRYRLVLYDAQLRRVVVSHRETWRTEPEDGSNGLRLFSVDNRGRALIEHGEAGMFVIGRGQALTRVKAPRLYPTTWDGWPRGAMLERHGSAGSTAVYGTISGRGRFHEVGRLPFDNGVRSPSGDQFLVDTMDSQYHPAFWAFRIADGVATQLGRAVA